MVEPTEMTSNTLKSYIQDIVQLCCDDSRRGKKTIMERIRTTGERFVKWGYLSQTDLDEINTIIFS